MSNLKKCLLLAGAMVLAITAGCGDGPNGKIVLRVANCEEYIDLGDWDEDEVLELESADVFGENSMMDDFEEWVYETYGIEVEVEYSTYGTNEELYNQMSLGNVFDLVCPSDYMIMKLMGEGRLEPLSDEFYDAEGENSYYAQGVSPFIAEKFDSLIWQGESLSTYAACYMWGSMGLVYNPDELSEEDMQHWDMLLNPEYSKRVTMKDSVRDSLFAAQCIAAADTALSEEFRADENYYENLSAMLNDTSQEAVDKVEDILSQMRQNAYSLETDSGKADMITGKVIANMQWSGDAVYTMDQAEEDDYYLNYAVPEECTNMWFDGWVMMADGIDGDAQKKMIAEAFINYISMPENVVRNMYYIGYTSGISGGDSTLIKEYIEYNYGYDEEEIDEEDPPVDYDLSYFFGEEYSVETYESQTRRQLFAQYPTEDVISRAVVMNCFENDANERIMTMWTNIRCFDLKSLWN